MTSIIHDYKAIHQRARVVGQDFWRAEAQTAAAAPRVPIRITKTRLKLMTKSIVLKDVQSPERLDYIAKPVNIDQLLSLMRCGCSADTAIESKHR